ncbi:MAG: hypothetical protein RL134_1162 [Actinomycetota bacterium]
MSQARVRRMDLDLAAATVGVIAEEGWAGLSFSSVAERAGTSRRPLQDRFDDRYALAAATWRDHIEPALRRDLVAALSYAGLVDQPPDSGQFAQALDTFAHPARELRAACELLIVSHFDPVMAAVVRETLEPQITVWCTPVEGVLAPAMAAKRAYVIGAALGLTMIERRPGVVDVALHGAARVLLSALATDLDPRRVPIVPAPHIDGPVAFDTGDETRDRLLQATLDEIGHRGFDATTVEAIAERAGSSQGALFARYPTKMALFVDAAERQLGFALRANESWMASIEKDHGRGVAEAALIRETQDPTRGELRAVALEELRLSWHNADLRARIAKQFDEYVVDMQVPKPHFDPGEVQLGYAVGAGVLVLPLLCPGAWTLPYDVVTVAWEG